jgi:hypothetical protein
MMNLFKAKTADQLEEKLMNIVNGFSHTVGLKDEVTTKVKNAEGHIKLGTMGGLGIGLLGLVGGIASIPLIPAIATTAAIGGFTVAGVAMLGGGAGMMAGLSYAGLGKLYTKYQESKLGDLTSKIFEDHRMKIEDNKFERDFSNKFHKQTDYKTYSEHMNLHSLTNAVKKGDMTKAQEIVKSIVERAELPEGKNKKQLFKAPVADELSQNLGNFFDTYKRKLYGLENQSNQIKAENKMGYGGLVAALGSFGAAAGLVAASSAVIATGGIAISVAAMGYIGIQAIKKAGFAQTGRNERALELDAERHMNKVAQDLNIDVKDLKSIQTMMEKKPSNVAEMKEKFINETTSRIKQKVS